MERLSRLHRTPSSTPPGRRWLRHVNKPKPGLRNMNRPSHQLTSPEPLMPHRLAAALLFLLVSCCAASARDTGTDPSLVIEKYIQHFVVNTDGSFTLTVDNVKLLAQQRAVQGHGQYYISYNKTLDDVIAVEAYTEKPDGRRVQVQPGQIKDQQESASSDAPMFQDTRMKIVVFPEVAVGDRLVVHYVVKRSTPLFPGQFEDLSSSQFYLNKQFQLIYDMPESMPLYADAVGFVPLPIDSPPGRRRYHWQYVGGDNQRIESESVSYLDYGKRLAVSTFADYAAFAQAYDARARDKAQGNPAIAALAHELTDHIAGARAKALALSNWVRRNIRYVGVYIGAGGVVPHPAPTVLENRYGDCKDHASLLEALLDAVGIESTGALINSGNAYRLPRTPTLGIFNHVITYVPSLDLYLDSTAESVAAGYLPAGDLGKPVLLTRSGKLASTPSTQAEKNRTVTSFRVQKDGRSSFNVAKTTRGAIAEPYRQAVRDTRQADRELFVERMLQGLGQKGSGVFDVGRVDGNGDEYSMSFAGTSENFANLPGPTGLATTFNFWGGMGDTVFAFGQETERRQDFVCPAIDTEEETGFDFPKAVRILAFPRQVALRDANFSYVASYSRTGNKVVVKRHLTFRHDGIVCTPGDYKRMQPLVDRIIRDLKSQIVVTAL
jgi:transglutaminase-like putative cysteine protease